MLVRVQNLFEGRNFQKDFISIISFCAMKISVLEIGNSLLYIRADIIFDRGTFGVKQ